jgi:hypothetical protein
MAKMGSQWEGGKKKKKKHTVLLNYLQLGPLADLPSSSNILFFSFGGEGKLTLLDSHSLVAHEFQDAGKRIYIYIYSKFLFIHR